MEDERIYQAINAVSERVNDIASRLDAYTNARVNEITPYEATATVYYGETEKTFYNVPSGILTVVWDYDDGNYAVERNDDTVRLLFTPITVAEATITIMVQ